MRRQASVHTQRTPRSQTFFSGIEIELSQGEPSRDADARLLRNVHPADWRNPIAKPRYHLVVIGAGTAGLVTAAIAAGLGAHVAFIERGRMGGDCLNVGCVPSKAMLRAARSWREARESATRFGGPRASAGEEFGEAMARMRRIRADLSAIDSAERFRSLGVDVFLGEATFASESAVQVEGQTLRFRRCVIATGGRPALPEITGLAESGYLTNESVFDLTELPPRMTAVGAGPIGCELAQAFAHFGSKVTLIASGERILPREDADAAAVVSAAMTRGGVTILTGATAHAIARRDGSRVLRVSVAGAEREITSDAVLVATGRAPNVESLGLERAGIACTAHGVTVDDRLRTSNRSVFAIGDVASRFQFTHVADAQARMVVQNALFLGRGRASRLVVPWCTYTSPELAHVGLYEEEARAQGIDVESVTIEMAHVDRAVLDGESEGFLRVLVRRGSDRIIGATLVSANAGDLISFVTLAMTSGAGLGAVGRTIFPYPTRAEVIRKAADALRRGKLTPRVKSLFALFFRLFR